MATQLTRRGRAEVLNGFGFVNPQCEPAASYGIVLLQSAALLYVGCWISFLLIPAAPASIDTASKVLLVTLIVTASLAIAIIPKMHWGFANSGILRKTPVAFVVGAGVCALVLAAVLNMAAGALLIGGWPGAWTRLSEGAVFLPASFITAATMAWLVQDHRWAGFEPSRKRRMLDAAVFGGMWIAATLIARALMNSAFVANLLDSDPQPLMHWETWGAVIVALALGIAVGFLAPGAVRRPMVRIVLTTAPAELERLTVEVERAGRGYPHSEAPEEQSVAAGVVQAAA